MLSSTDLWNDVASAMARALIENDGIDLSNIHALISLGLGIETMEMTILLHGSSFELQSDTIGDTAGLLPSVHVNDNKCLQAW